MANKHGYKNIKYQQSTNQYYGRKQIKGEEIISIYQDTPELAVVELDKELLRLGHPQVHNTFTQKIR